MANLHKTGADAPDKAPRSGGGVPSLLHALDLVVQSGEMSAVGGHPPASGRLPRPLRKARS
jgi:hypothetical protein